MNGGKPKINQHTRKHLLQSAQTYECAAFLEGDPAWFMHQVEGNKNQEAMAFIASCLSYGSRVAFLPKIHFILEASKGEVYDWVKEGKFQQDIPNDSACYYRLYTNSMMIKLLQALQEMYLRYDSIENFLRWFCNDNTFAKYKKSHYGTSTTDLMVYHKPPAIGNNLKILAANPSKGKISALEAVNALCFYFAEQKVEGIIPKNVQSSCKRLCMFLRWLVRDNSAVDLGIWSDFIDKKTLIIPLDTHVITQATELGLIQSKSVTMRLALQLTSILLDVFPDDPLKGDYALYGHAVSKT